MVNQTQLKLKKKTLNSISINRIESPKIISVSVINIISEKKKESTKLPTSLFIFCTSLDEFVLKWNM